jgi:cbb3-type cytochrome oxidase subunit 3
VQSFPAILLLAFTKGQLIFAAVFAIIFIAGMYWAYGRDKSRNRIHYRKVYLVLVGIIVIFSLLFAIVKLKSKLF